MISNFPIAVVGSVDAGKSTTIGVFINLEKNNTSKMNAKTSIKIDTDADIVNNIANLKIDTQIPDTLLDDGKGKAREKVMVHNHEKTTGRTSDISMKQTGKLLFVDLAGHEKYAGTTLKGLTNCFPKLALLMVESGKGRGTNMTEEHFMHCRRLRIPIIVVITKTDACPSPEGFKETLTYVKYMCKETKVRHALEIYPGSLVVASTTEIFKPTNPEDLENKVNAGLDAFTNLPNDVVPIFRLSNKTGDGLNLLYDFLNRVATVGFTQQTNQPNKNTNSPVASFETFMQEKNFSKAFFIYRPFFIKGIGLVVHGTNKGGTINVKDQLYIGPIGNEYKKVRVWSIHDELKNSLSEMPSGMSGCLAIKPLDTKFEFEHRMFRGGKVLVDKPVIIREIRVEVEVCGGKSTTTIRPGYMPFMNCAHLNISGRVVQVENTKDSSRGPVLGQGDRGFLTIQFLSSQFIYPNARMLIRDSRVKVIGIIREVRHEHTIKEFYRKKINQEINALEQKFNNTPYIVDPTECLPPVNIYDFITKDSLKKSIEKEDIDLQQNIDIKVESQ